MVRFSKHRIFEGKSAHEKTVAVFELTLDSGQRLNSVLLARETKVVAKVISRSEASERELQVHGYLTEELPSDVVSLYAGYTGALDFEELSHGLSDSAKAEMRAALPQADEYTVLWMECMEGTLDDATARLIHREGAIKRTDAEVDQLVERIFEVTHAVQEKLLKQGLFNRDPALRNIAFRKTGAPPHVLLKALDFGEVYDKRAKDELNSKDSELRSAIKSQTQRKIRITSRAKESTKHTGVTPQEKLTMAKSRRTPVKGDAAALLSGNSNPANPDGSRHLLDEDEDGIQPGRLDLGSSAGDDDFEDLFDLDAENARTSFDFEKPEAPAVPEGVRTRSQRKSEQTRQ